jgi:hypothetical protein
MRPLMTIVRKEMPTTLAVSSPARSSVRFSPTGKLGTKNKRARTTKIVTGRNVPKINDLLK